MHPWALEMEGAVRQDSNGLQKALFRFPKSYCELQCGSKKGAESTGFGVSNIIMRIHILHQNACANELLICKQAGESKRWMYEILLHMQTQNAYLIFDAEPVIEYFLLLKKVFSITFSSLVIHPWVYFLWKFSRCNFESEGK